MSAAKTALVVGGLAAVGTAVYYFWPKGTPTITAQPGDTVITGNPTPENPSAIPASVVAQDQTRLNTIAAKQGWTAVTVNGVINDPTFTATLQKFQTWFNQTYPPAAAAIATAPNMNGILDANTSGALIYVYNLDSAPVSAS